MNFVPNYKDLIASFRTANAAAKIYLCIPPPVFPNAPWGIRGDVMRGQIDPMIEGLIQSEQTARIDFLQGNPELFPDKVHPREPGALRMAGLVYEALTGKTAPLPSPSPSPTP